MKSLCWETDCVADYLGISTRFFLDGKIIRENISYSYRFDAAASIMDGLYMVVYERFGTKGLIIKEGKLVREINRSFYCADDYEYPVVLFTRGDAVLIAHCPDEYNVIEIENIGSGERLTQKDRVQRDFFQSRLQVSPNQKWLLSAGWVWHPVDGIELYDLSGDISDPPVLSQFWSEGLGDLGLWEINNAIFIDNSTLLLGGTGDTEHEDGLDEKAIVVYDIDKRSIVSRAVIAEETGKLMALNHEFAIAFFKHPKLIDLKTGNISHRWTDIPTDEQNSSISHHTPPCPLAIDVANKRFAVATPNSIEVIVLEG